jgi:hypothetical protein
MIDLRTYMCESIFDDDDTQFDKIDQTISGYTDAMDALSKHNKIRPSDIEAILRNLKLTEKFGMAYFSAKQKSFEDAENIFMSVVSNILNFKKGDKEYSIFNYFHKILYKYYSDVWWYNKDNDSRIGYGPRLAKGFNSHIKDELINSGFNSFENAIVWLAWSYYTSPSSKYMLKTTKDMDKDETEFMIKFMTVLKKMI